MQKRGTEMPCVCSRAAILHQVIHRLAITDRPRTVNVTQDRQPHVTRLLALCHAQIAAGCGFFRVGTWIDETLFEPNGGAIGSDQLHFPTQGKVLVLYRVFEEDPMLSRISLLLLTVASLTLTAYFGAEAWRASDGTLPSPLAKRSSLYR